MNIENRYQISKLEQLPDGFPRRRKFQCVSSRIRPRVEKHHFAETGAIHRLDPCQIDYQPACCRQYFRDEFRERPRFRSKDEATLTTQHQCPASVSLETQPKIFFAVGRYMSNPQTPSVSWIFRFHASNV